MIKEFKIEGDEFRAYIAENPAHSLIRGKPEGTIVLTGADRDSYLAECAAIERAATQE